MRLIFIALLLFANGAFAQSSSVKVWDGSETATVRDTGSSDSLNVAITDASGNQVTSFGGGTQYTEGDVDASVTGTALMWRSGGNAMTPVTAAAPLPTYLYGGLVDLDSTTLASTFKVQIQTDNAGLCTETTLDGVRTSTQLLDDAVATTGSAITTKGFAASGTDGTNARILKTDTSGELQIDVLTMPTTTVTGTVAATQSGTWTVQPGNTANSTPWLTSDNAITTGGYTPYTFGALVDSVQTVKGSAGTLGGYYILNSAATVCYVQFFDTTGAVTLGTTVPTFSLGLPAGAAANIAATRPGIAFSNGLKIAATTTRAGLTACGTGVDVNLWYK